MFIEINKNTYVNILNIKGIELKEIKNSFNVLVECYWVFILDNNTSLYSKHFEGLGCYEEAIAWFEKNIKPYMEVNNES